MVALVEIRRTLAPLATVLFNAVPLAVIFYGFRDELADYLQSQRLRDYQGHVEEFDFIIVGGGSAGSVLANRLTKDGIYSVALIEAGGNPNPIQSIPLLFSVILHSPQVDYEYYTVPQQNSCLALKNQKSYWPRGKGLGGTSNLNSMLFQRGNKNDYDKWAELSGDDEWRFESVLRNFKNIEDYHGQFWDDRWHSRDGVHVTVTSEQKLLPEFLEAAREMGYPTKDVNGFQEAAFSPLDFTIKNGRRHDAYTAFLKPILHRKNLKIYRYSHVYKIEFDINLKAVGVKFRRHGVNHFFKAKREIILSAGAIDTPKLLMLSGIGPKSHLEKIGIKTLVDLPVGQNLQDHVMTYMGPFILNSTNLSYNLPRDITIDTLQKYFQNGTGLLSNPTIANGVGYIHSSLALKKTKATMISPDIQLLFLPLNPQIPSSYEKGLSLKDGYLKHNVEGTENDDVIFINVMLAKPKSRGELKLASASSLDKPVLDPKYFSHPDDVKIIAEGMNFTVTMVETTKAFQKFGAHLINRHTIGCEHLPLKSMEYYECYARHVTLTVYHQSGTCTMRKAENDPNAVVDSKLRVRNTKGLRVVDASIMPEIPNSNLNAAVYMIADKASEIILDYWNRNEIF